MPGAAPPSAALPAGALACAWAAALLAALASAVGLFQRDVYRDPETFIDAGWIGNDLVTLVLAVPVLAWATWSSRAGSLRPALIWLGALAFMLYNHAFYLFGAAPNRLLGVYAAIVALSLLALVLGVVWLGQQAPLRVASGTRRFLLGYMGAWAAVLGALWLSQLGGFAASGEAPDLNGSAHAFRVTAALDLVLVVPFVALAVVLLWRRSPWAHATAAILNVKGVLYPAVLVASSLAAWDAGVDGALTLVPLWVAFLMLSSVACCLLLRRPEVHA